MDIYVQLCPFSAALRIKKHYTFNAIRLRRTERICAFSFSKRTGGSQAKLRCLCESWLWTRPSPGLTGGGLIRSLGGWAASKKMRLKGQDRLKGEEWILCDSDFVRSILAEANDKL